MGVNQIFLLGNVGKDPELRQAGESTVANFSLAVNDRRRKGKDGQPATEWFNIVAWGKLADICGKYIKKGTRICLQGRVQTRTWEGDDGKRQYRTEVVMEQLELLSGKDQADGGSDPDDPGF